MCSEPSGDSARLRVQLILSELRGSVYSAPSLGCHAVLS
jgi:hypothetical protein